MKVLMENTPVAVMPLAQSSLKGKKIAIDTSIILYQYITAIRGTGSDLKGPNNITTSHIQAILSKTLYYLKLGFIPIHVIDGKPSHLKMKILNDRSKIKKEAISKLITIETDNLNREVPLTELEQSTIEEERIKLLKKTVSVSKNDIKEIIEIIELLGVPCILAPEEADSQCAYLSRNNLVDFVASEDMDLLTFGTKTVIKNFLKKDMQIITLDDILSEGNITMDEFIDLCILLGCDYTDTIEGIGQKKAWELIIKYKSIEQIIEKEKKIKENKYVLPDNFRYVESKEYFTNPRHIEVNDSNLVLKTPQLNELKKLLVNKYGFSEDNVEHMIKFLRKRYNMWDTDYENKNIKKNLDVFSDNEEISNNMKQVNTKMKRVNNKTKQVDKNEDKTIDIDKTIDKKTIDIGKTSKVKISKPKITK